MKQVISENDYERYKIYVPVKFFAGGKQRKYISSQLEKLHPCFSDNFCFDSKYKVSRKGLYANVVVMDKLRLGEYKANYPGTKLCCGEKEGTRVFENKNKKIFVTAIFSLVLLGALFGTHFGNDAKKKNDVQVVQNVISSEGKIESENFVYEKFFSSFENETAKVESLSWKYDGFTEQFLLSVVDCFPDSIPVQNARNVTFSNIDYVNDRPSFSVNVINQKTADFESRVFDVGDDYRSKIRDALKEKSIKLLNESYIPYKIRFQLSQKDIENKSLSLLEKVSSEAGLCAKEINLNVSGVDLTDMEILFSKDFFYTSEKPILSCIESNWKILAMKKQPVKQSANSGVKVLAMPAKSAEAKIGGDKKIGTIIHADGGKVDFYKTTKGVIRYE